MTLESCYGKVQGSCVCARPAVSPLCVPEKVYVSRGFNTSSEITLFLAAVKCEMSSNVCCGELSEYFCLYQCSTEEKERKNTTSIHDHRLG